MWARNKQPFDFFISLICMVTKIAAQIREIWHVSFSLHRMLYRNEWQDNYAWWIGKKMGSYKTVVCTLWPSTLALVTHSVFIKYSINILNILILSFKNPIWNFTITHICVAGGKKLLCTVLTEYCKIFSLHYLGRGWKSQVISILQISSLHIDSLRLPEYKAEVVMWCLILHLLYRGDFNLNIIYVQQLSEYGWRKKSD